MLSLVFHQLHRLALLVTLAVALTATGFAHRIAAPDQASNIALAFALANGATAADFCGDGMPGDSHAKAPCLACQIAGTAALPAAPAVLQDLDLVALSRVTAPCESRAVARRLDLSHAPQGPPTV